LIYRACAYHFSRNLKAMAMVQGAEGVDLDEEWYGPDASNNSSKRVMEMYDMPGIAASGLSLGFEKQG